jgi:hypothetical protein
MVGSETARMLANAAHESRLPMVTSEAGLKDTTVPRSDAGSASLAGQLRTRDGRA